MLKWKAFSALASSLCLVLLIALVVQHQRASAASAKAPALTALDYIEIQQLQNKYGIDIDTCTNNGYDYADLYTPDGVFIDKYSDEGFQEGRSAARQGPR